MSKPGGDNILLRRVSNAMFWNASMVPVIMAVNMAAAVMLRRGFGLESGTYDVALGVVNTLLAHSGLGVPLTLSQLVPSIERTGGRSGVARFLTSVVALRLGLMLVALVGLNVFAAPIADRLHLGAGGIWLLRIVSVLALLRAASEFAVLALQATLAHFLANAMQLLQAVTFVGVVAWTASHGASMHALFTGLALTAVAITLASASALRRHLRTLPAEPSVAEPTSGASWRNFWRFSLFMYVLEVSHYFTTPAFASPALAAAAGGPATVALFNVAFQFPMMVVLLSLAGFQGLNRTLLARVLAEKNPERVRIAFSEISKVQAALLIPPGVGLALLLPDYIPLLFTREFTAAVPLAQLLCTCLFLEALLNLGSLLLSADYRYTAVLTSHAVRIMGAPVFVWLAVRGDLVLATAAFGAGRVVSAALGYMIARRLYGVRYPVGFAARVCMPTALMGIVVAVGRLVLPSSWPSAMVLTLLGAAIAILGMRWFRVLGPREIDLLRRSALPGGSTLLGWLSPSSRTS